MPKHPDLVIDDTEEFLRQRPPLSEADRQRLNDNAICILEDDDRQLFGTIPGLWPAVLAARGKQRDMLTSSQVRRLARRLNREHQQSKRPGNTLPSSSQKSP